MDGKGQMGGQVTPCNQIIILPNTRAKVGQQATARDTQHPGKASWQNPNEMLITIRVRRIQKATAKLLAHWLEASNTEKGENYRKRPIKLSFRSTLKCVVGGKNMPSLSLQTYMLGGERGIERT